MEYHKYANLFPMMNEKEFEDLCSSISKGYHAHNPIIIYQGKILDGRNRQRACERVNVLAMYSEFIGTDDEAFEYAKDNNLTRKHWTPDQLAMIALELEPIEAERARQRMAAGGGDKTAGSADQHYPVEDKGKAAEKAAKKTGASVRKVQRAKALKKKSTKLAEEVKAGNKSLVDAEKEVKKEERKKMHEDKRMRPLPAGKYAVIYADPPWKYDNSGFNEAADNQYPTMPIDEICKLPIEQLADNATVLFLWATNPLLIEALQVMKEWGFEYKTNMAWIKDAGRGKGWFLKSKHELLLIGTRPGSPHPAYRPDSCFEADRGNVHSRKPKLAREIIEQMYSGKKVELFAREKYEDWEVWGNEPDVDS